MRSKSDLLTSASRPNFDAIRLHLEYVDPGSIILSRPALTKKGRARIKKLAAAIDRWGLIFPLTCDDKLDCCWDTTVWRLSCSWG